MRTPAATLCSLFAALTLLAGNPATAGGQAVPASLRAAREISRGTALTLDDIESGEAQAAQAREITGWIARRVIHQGEALKAPAVAPPPLVQAGATVTIEASTGGISATRTGVAIGGGTLGSRVRVRVDAYRIVTATITGPATVRLSPGDHR